MDFLPPLLDVTPPIRSLIWQYMNNRSAISYLRTCRQLHALYHSFPLTEPVSLHQLSCFPVISTAIQDPVPTASPAPALPLIYSVYAAALILLYPKLLFPAFQLILNALPVVPFGAVPVRTSCCDKSSQLAPYGSRVQRIPRVIRVAEKCWSGAAVSAGCRGTAPRRSFPRSAQVAAVAAEAVRRTTDQHSGATHH